jgi:monoterpene epsilon-lactone hydrolase
MPSQEMQDVIDGLRDQQKASASQAPPTLEQRRAAFAPAGRLHPVPDDVMVTEVTAGGVPAHWLAAPGADTGRVLMFLHGGGFQMGSLRSDGELAARLGRAAGMRVLFPEYRLAPEDPFPAAIGRRLDRLALAPHQPGPARGIDGGGRRLGRRRARRRPARGPPGRRAATARGRGPDVTDGGPDQFGSLDDRTCRSRSLLHPRIAPSARLRHLAGADPQAPLASPLFAPLTGFPPLLIQAGTADLLLSDAERLAAAALRTGVDVTLHIGEGLPHVYPIMLGTPEAAQATEQTGNFLRTRVP